MPHEVGVEGLSEEEHAASAIDVNDVNANNRHASFPICFRLKVLAIVRTP